MRKLAAQPTAPPVFRCKATVREVLALSGKRILPGIHPYKTIHPSQDITQQLTAKILASSNIPLHSVLFHSERSCEIWAYFCGHREQRPQDKAHFNHTCSEVT